MTKPPETQNKTPLRPFPDCWSYPRKRERALRHLIKRARQFYPEGVLEFPGSLMDSLTETREYYCLEFMVNGVKHLVYKFKKGR
jgi:hypothetical protein